MFEVGILSSNRYVYLGYSTDVIALTKTDRSIHEALVDTVYMIVSGNNFLA